MRSFISKYLSVNTYDLLKAGLVSFIYALLDGLVTYYSTNNHTLPDAAQCKALLVQGIMVFVAYVKVKAFTNSDGQLFKPEQQQPSSSETKNQ